MVQDVEEFSTELQAEALPNLRVFQQREIEVPKIRTAPGIPSQIAERPWRLQRETRRVVPFVHCPHIYFAAGNVVRTRSEVVWLRPAVRLIVAIVML